MPRLPRKSSSFNIYHIIIKGSDRQIIFEEERDYIKYLDFLSYYKESLNFEIYAYCLMSNHVHLLIYTPHTPLETIFRCINTKYSVWFNMKYNRTGYLQQGRYHSEPINDYSYFFRVIRYIHKNPQNAGIENFPGEKYKWSSIYSYINKDNSLVSIDYILDLFGGFQAFKSFHQINEEDNCMDLNTIQKRMPDDVAKEIITELTNCHTVKDFQSLSLKERDNYILLLHQKRISIRQLNRLTGIPRGVIERILAKKSSL